MIKFSHHYLKMPRDYMASWLVEVFVVPAETLSQSFRDYDATKDDCTLYPLPVCGKVLVLLLLTSLNRELWCDVRQHTLEKVAYYRGLIGTLQECNIVEEKK